MKNICLLGLFLLLYKITSSINYTKEREVLCKEVVIKSNRILSKGEINFPDSVFNHIKHYEVYKAKPYTLGGAWYIGYGHAILPNEKFDSISEKEATILQLNDLLIFSIGLEKLLKKDSIVLAKNQKIALLLLAFNCGLYKIPKWNLWDSIKSGGDCSIWLKYCCFNGKPHGQILERREYELKLFLTN